MRQAAGDTYAWQVYERIILGFTLFFVSLPVFEVVYIIGDMFWVKGPPFLHQDITWVHIVMATAIHLTFFGALAYVFPKVYILPVWLLNLIGFFLNVKQVVTMVTHPYDPNILYYSGMLTIFTLFSAIILFRPSWFYALAIWRKIIFVNDTG